MPAKQFIDQLEAQGLLAPNLIEELRRQVEESKSRITASSLARILVENGHLTKFQATKLISEINQDSTAKDSAAGKDSPGKDSPGKDSATKDSPGKTSTGSTAKNRPSASDDELGFAPSEESAESDKGKGNQALILDDDEIVEVETLGDDLVEVEAIDEVQDVEVVDNIVEVEQLDEIIDPTPQAGKRITKLEKSGSKKSSSKLRKLEKKAPVANASAKPGKNQWESRNILFLGTFLAILLVAGVTLAWHFLRGNADELLTAADESYKQRSYEEAIKRYDSFTEKFPTHEQVSFARVRAHLSQLRKDVEGLPDPTEALKTAQDVLPKMDKETSLSSERGDLAGALVQLAQKFNEKADAAPETAKKKELMTSVDTLNQIMADPQYVGNAGRQQNAIALARIDEDRNRILRDISRDEELQNALQAIDAKLKESATADAYQIRRDLINRFPQLEKDPGVMTRVVEAAQLQRSLVVPATPDVKTQAEAPPMPQSRTVSLTARAASKEAPQLAGRILCVRAKGTIYGLDGQTGNLKWRTYMGRDMIEDPVRLTDAPDSDVIVCRPELGQLTRLAGATGTTKWFCALGGPAFAPRVDGEEMVVSLRDGTLLNIDPENGQLKWASRMPQAIQLTPMVSAEKPNIYLPGDHSNLYVLSRQDGTCKEVLYLGHRSGAIAVPPVLLLGQLFVFENRTNDRSFIHILQTDDTGLQLAAKQEQIQIEGNIVTPPLVDGRKLIVLSDRGQIKVLDIEPTSEKNKVTVVASEVASESKPTMSWGVAAKNQLWMVNHGFSRRDIQVTTQKLVYPPWIKEDGDQFVGPPQKFDDVIVHTRVVRGTRGVRVAAVRAETGETLWATDVGVPVALLTSPGEKRFEAITTSSALFAIDAFQSVSKQIEHGAEPRNPMVLYDNPRYLAGGTISLNNQSNDGRIAVYTPGTANRLKIVTSNFGGAKPTSPPAVVDKHLAFGLDSGQIVIVDPTTGSNVATPFQPSVEPGRKHAWNQAAYMADTKTLFATDSRRKLYRLTLGDTLKLMSEADIDGAVVGPLATAGKKVAMVVSNRTDESLILLDGVTLAKAGSTILDGRWQAGPFPIDADRFLIQTERKLQAFDSNGAQAWSLDFPHVRLAGAPVAGPTGLVVAATDGRVWRIDAASGAVKNSVNVQQPLSTTPLAIQGGMLLGTDEGTVLLVQLTDSTSAAKGTQ